MPRIGCRLAVMVALAAGLLSRGPAVGGAAAGTAAEALAKLFAHRQGESFEAAFRQTKYIALLVEPLESRGRVLFDASEGLRWEVTEPRALVVDTRGGRIRAGPPGELRELTSAQIGPFASLPGGFSGVFGASAAEIQAAFEVAALAASGCLSTDATR